jgi:hypothetical protein
MFYLFCRVSVYFILYSIDLILFSYHFSCIDLSHNTAHEICSYLFFFTSLLFTSTQYNSYVHNAHHQHVEEQSVCTLHSFSPISHHSQSTGKVQTHSNLPHPLILPNQTQHKTNTSLIPTPQNQIVTEKYVSRISLSLP